MGSISGVTPRFGYTYHVTLGQLPAGYKAPPGYSYAPGIPKNKSKDVERIIEQLLGGFGLRQFAAPLSQGSNVKQQPIEFFVYRHVVKGPNGENRPVIGVATMANRPSYIINRYNRDNRHYETQRNFAEYVFERDFNAALIKLFPETKYEFNGENFSRAIHRGVARYTGEFEIEDQLPELAYKATTDKPTGKVVVVSEYTTIKVSQPKLHYYSLDGQTYYGYKWSKYED